MGNKFPELIEAIYKIVFPLSIGLSMFFIIKAGVTLMTSQGDPAKAQDGKDDLTSAIMGLVFVVISLTLLSALIDILPST